MCPVWDRTQRDDDETVIHSRRDVNNLGTVQPDQYTFLAGFRLMN